MHDTVTVQTSRGSVGGYVTRAGGGAPTVTTIVVLHSPTLTTTATGVHFRGVPFGAPISGANRAKGPQPREPWEGVMDCSKFGEAPVQRHDTGIAKLMGRKTSGDIGKMGDDCLNMNIVTPDTAGNAPVMVVRARVPWPC